MSTDQHYAVDRIRHRTALLVDDQERQILVPTSRLPRELAEGQVLLVPVDEAGKETIEEMKERDPGGDVTL
jgi:hypothetical protein